MTTVYRIEDADGKGMYCSDSLNPVEYDDRRHPTPEYDSLLMASGFNPRWQEYSYGFISIEQLRSWIYRDEWLQELHDRGFILAVIESDDAYDAYVGNTQAVFVRPAKYAKHSIAEYFKL